MSLKNKYNRPKPTQIPKRKGNLDVISQIVQNKASDTVIQVRANTGRKVKKATFELNADLHRKLRTYAALNDTTMLDIVEKAINEYLERNNQNF